MCLEQVKAKRMLHRVVWRYVAVGCLAAVLSLSGGCSEPAVKLGDDQPAERPPIKAEPISVVLPELEDPNRWLIVQKVESGGDGGWATGSFEQSRNKIVIETHDVESFVIDTSRVAINWKKLVILRIDGRNSELRKRDQQVLHFMLDNSGRWVVKEAVK